MIGPFFVDTNVLIYSRDLADSIKRQAALKWLNYLWRQAEGRISFQVLQEFYSKMLKIQQDSEALPSLRQDTMRLLAWRPVSVDGGILQQAWLLQDRYSVSWWDALVFSAAQRSRCRYLLTEDNQDGMRMGDLEIVNPFRRAPESFGLGS